MDARLPLLLRLLWGRVVRVLTCLLVAPCSKHHPHGTRVVPLGGSRVGIPAHPGTRTHGRAADVPLTKTTHQNTHQNK